MVLLEVYGQNWYNTIVCQCRDGFSSTYAAAGQIAASKEMGGLECSNNGNAKRFETHLLPWDCLLFFFALKCKSSLLAHSWLKLQIGGKKVLLELMSSHVCKTPFIVSEMGEKIDTPFLRILRLNRKLQFDPFLGKGKKK